MKEYNPHEIEPRLQGEWAKADLFHVPDNDDKPKKYILEMFPYPSGDIHMGHVRNYSIGDVLARYHRMRGFDVLHPMGWDAFGLPAENAAIKHHSHPAKWTYANIETQKSSFKRMGFSYDWDRTVVACDPEYYRWGQWIFEQFWKKGLVERRNSPVNWCPSCKTVLANEQVIEGRCWRCHSEVEKRDLTQWYFKITDYAQELLDDLDQLDGWPERVKQQQANWIGRSEGAEVDFVLCDADGNAPADPTDDDIITVFTTRADTLFGCSFFVLAPEYKGLDALVAGTAYEQPVKDLVEAAKKVTAVERAQGNHEKHGAFTGRYVMNPINGQKVPVWVADYVVADYGTGAVMAVPCGDQRDFEFARKYDLPIVPIILGEDDPLYDTLKDEQNRVVTSVDWDEAYAAEGRLVQSGPYTGMVGGKHSEGEAAVVAALEEMGRGRRKVEYRLRDWLISRQRYWGNAVRTYILFMAPPDKDLQWDEEGLAGIYKFLNRVWRQVYDLVGAAGEDTLYQPANKGKEKPADAAKTLLRERHRVVGKVGDDMERDNFNTAIAAIMELSNAAGTFLHVTSAEDRAANPEWAALARDAAETIVKLLAPMAPHWADELWNTVLGHEGFLYNESWPTFDPEKAKADEVELAVQVNGKVRARITVAADAAEDDVRAAALEAVAAHTEGKQVVKAIVIPGRLVNIVVK